MPDEVVKNEYNFDAFFIYKTNMETGKWIKRTCDRLEQANFRCGYHERDFKAGMTKSENIRQCIKHSKKIVVLVTPEFKDSVWCKYDLDITVRPEKLNEGRVIPLYMNLTSKDQIPDSLEVYTALDVSAEQDEWWDKFDHAVDDTSREREKIQCR